MCQAMKILFQLGFNLNSITSIPVTIVCISASQKLTNTQQRWATIEKEAYAIVWALTKLKEVIIGSKIRVFTDHNPLT